jgi:anti-sigma factor ChrR (cupin superfamily)
MNDENEELRAAELALGVLDTRTEAVARLRLVKDPALAEAVATWERRLTALAAAAPPATPDPALFDRVLAGTRASSQSPAANLIVRADEGVWREVAPGITMKPLWTDARTGRQAMLARCAPGAVFPGYTHACDEECLVLEGEIRFGELLLRAGDFHLARAGTEHPAAVSPGGCLLYLSGAL